MVEVIASVVVLLGLIGLQTGLRYWNVLRTKKAWEGVQDDLTRGDLDAAVTGIGRCIKLMPLWLQPRFLLGAVLAKQGKLDVAEEQLKMAIALEPRQPDGHIELGIFYITAADRTDAGIAAFKEAITHDEKARRRLETDPRLQEFRRSDAYAQLEA